MFAARIEGRGPDWAPRGAGVPSAASGLLKDTELLRSAAPRRVAAMPAGAAHGLGLRILERMIGAKSSAASPIGTHGGAPVFGGCVRGPGLRPAGASAVVAAAAVPGLGSGARVPMTAAGYRVRGLKRLATRPDRWAPVVVPAAQAATIAALLLTGVPASPWGLLAIGATLSSAPLSFVERLPSKLKGPARAVYSLAGPVAAAGLFSSVGPGAAGIAALYALGMVVILRDAVQAARSKRGVPPPFVRHMIRSGSEKKALSPGGKDWLDGLSGGRKERRRAVREMSARSDEAFELRDAVYSLAQYEVEPDILRSLMRLIGRWGDKDSIGQLMLYASGLREAGASEARAVLEELSSRAAATKELDELKRLAEGSLDGASSEHLEALAEAKKALSAMPSRTLPELKRREALARRILQLERALASNNKTAAAIALQRLKRGVRH